MPVKHYGIYLAYAPTVDLRHEGLGRYLASFLRGAQQCEDTSFTVACPSWSRQAVMELLESEGLNAESVAIISPQGKPYLLRLYEAYQAYLQRPRNGLWRRAIAAVRHQAQSARQRLERRLAQANDIGSLLLLLLHGSLLLLLLVLLAPFAILWVLLSKARQLLLVPLRRLLKAPWLALRNRLQQLISDPKEDGWVVRLFQTMHAAESRRMQVLIESRNDISAWYCPTAFWPDFNRIDRPRLMCVPDLMPSDFAIGFARTGGDRLLGTFETVKQAIAEADHLVTYSHAVKWTSLVDHHGLQASRVRVVPHAPNTLGQHLDIVGFDNPEATAHSYCRLQLLTAMTRCSHPHYAAGFGNGEVRFLFYPSQFRPNKNLLTLLKAYEHLLRQRFLPHKLILTGDPAKMSEIGDYIRSHQLENDVICLPRMSVVQLAACYRLADLAVNPSLSEGGCPFTFSEALSVGTPCVLARIPVTEEVLQDPQVQQASLFDPYDWHDMAGRIEWALNNREQLLALQNAAYAELGRRSWADVVREHIAILDDITHSPTASRNAKHAY